MFKRIVVQVQAGTVVKLFVFARQAIIAGVMHIIVAYRGVLAVNLDAGMTAGESGRSNYKAVKRNIVGVNVDSTESSISAGSKGQIICIDSASTMTACILSFLFLVSAPLKSSSKVPATTSEITPTIAKASTNMVMGFRRNEAGIFCIADCPLLFSFSIFSIFCATIDSQSPYFFTFNAN